MSILNDVLSLRFAHKTGQFQETISMHFASLPDTRAEQDPIQPCLSDDRLLLNNGDFAGRVRGAAAAFSAVGIGTDDIVAIMLPNQVELVVALFAAWRLGAAVTPIDPALTQEEAEYQLADSGAKLVVSENSNFSVPTITPDGLPTDGVTPEVECDPNSLALVIYTSGTTGRPKGVLLDHSNLTAMCEISAEFTELSAADHSLVILPLFHANGIVLGILTPLLVGGRATIARRFTPDTFFSVVGRVRPTYFSAVPAIYAMTLGRPLAEPVDFSSVRFVVCGGAPMPAQYITAFEARFGVPIVEGYGLSEATCASTANPLAGPRKPGTVGVPMRGQDVAIMDPDGRMLPTGDAGEVVVRGPVVMRGYLNRPDDTARTIVDGWLHTGDVGRFDEDGYLVLIDRIKDLIIRGAENIYPSEIEVILCRDPCVAEAAVVGAPDATLGEVPVAYVVPKPGRKVQPDELLEFCRTLLAKYKLPIEIHVLDHLPRNPAGKIHKPTLRARASSMENR
ncbi:class I adenylate-forming enzyme family protein [Nocardia rhizosphaerihabitans]|nr:AMP-binding protein [Nocardia rhizosphaerihabitans]